MVFLLINNPVFRPIAKGSVLWPWGRGSSLGTYFPSRVNNSPGQGLRGREHGAHRFLRSPMFSQGTLLTSSGIYPERLSRGFEQSWEFSPSCCVLGGGQAPPRLRHMPPRGRAREVPASRPPDPGRPVHSGLPGLQQPPAARKYLPAPHPKSFWKRRRVSREPGESSGTGLDRFLELTVWKGDGHLEPSPRPTQATEVTKGEPVSHRVLRLGPGLPSLLGAREHPKAFRVWVRISRAGVRSRQPQIGILLAENELVWHG